MDEIQEQQTQLINKIAEQLREKLIYGMIYGFPISDDDNDALIVASYFYGRSETEDILEQKNEIEGSGISWVTWMK